MSTSVQKKLEELLEQSGESDWRVIALRDHLMSHAKDQYIVYVAAGMMSGHSYNADSFDDAMKIYNAHAEQSDAYILLCTRIGSGVIMQSNY